MVKRTVNLEEELRKIHNPQSSTAYQQELILKEVNNLLTHLEQDDITILMNGGFIQNINQAKDYKKTNHYLSLCKLHLGEENIFTEEQIKKLCIKYRLRFLPAKLYAGSIDPQLPAKMRELEEKGAKFDLTSVRFTTMPTAEKYYIAAPKSSFKLREKNLDPLCFSPVIKVDGVKYFYLVHKWGEDLNAIRALLSVPERYPFIFVGSVWTLFAFIFYRLLSMVDNALGKDIVDAIMLNICISIGISFFLMALISFPMMHHESVWKSEFE